ncbi:Uncharacterised protein [Mycobacteroides abscessus subsp. massiliense]|nr:Uncharacterised protein [Mycobacteroides abscessus subsp. massiliense]
MVLERRPDGVVATAGAGISEKLPERLGCRTVSQQVHQLKAPVGVRLVFERRRDRLGYRSAGAHRGGREVGHAVRAGVDGRRVYHQFVHLRFRLDHTQQQTEARMVDRRNGQSGSDQVRFGGGDIGRVHRVNRRIAKLGDGDAVFRLRQCGEGPPQELRWRGSPGDRRVRLVRQPPVPGTEMCGLRPGPNCRDGSVGLQGPGEQADRPGKPEQCR